MFCPISFKKKGLVAVAQMKCSKSFNTKNICSLLLKWDVQLINDIYYTVFIIFLNKQYFTGGDRFFWNNDYKTNTTVMEEKWMGQNGGCYGHCGLIKLHFLGSSTFRFFPDWNHRTERAASSHRTGPESSQIHWSRNDTDSHSAHHKGAFCCHDHFVVSTMKQMFWHGYLLFQFQTNSNSKSK